MSFPTAFSSFFTATLPAWWTGLFQVTPPAEWSFRWVYVGLIAGYLVAGIVTAFLRIRPSVKQRILNFFWANAVLGLVLYFCRDQRLPFLGMDLLRFIQEIAMVIWANSIIWFARTHVQSEKVQEKVEERRNKYLPQAK